MCHAYRWFLDINEFSLTYICYDIHFLHYIYANAARAFWLVGQIFKVFFFLQKVGGGNFSYKVGNKFFAIIIRYMPLEEVRTRK